MEVLIAILIKIVQAIMPAILEQAKDTAEEGSAADVETWRDKIESSGWTDEAINATRAAREK